MKTLNNLKNCKVLAAGDSKSKVKPTLLCHTGVFQGMYGEVEVTLDMLQGMVEKYKECRSEPVNEFDYAPILKDHFRQADNVLGRLLLDGLEVRNWKVKNSKQEFGLFGNIRIDDEEALEKVNKGLYANVSVTFDENTLEIVEVSFVAVEAARGSIVLSKGETNMKRKQKKLSASGTKQTALSLAVVSHRTTRGTSLAAHSGNLKSLSAQVTELVTQANAISLSIKTGQVKNRFVDFIKQGKMNPAELLKIDAQSLAMLPETALSAVLTSYETRPVSKDAFQFGQSTDQTVTTDLSPEKLREAIKLQRAGKGTKSLAGEEKVEDKDKDSMSAEDTEKAKEMMKSYAMDEESFKKCLSDMDEVTKKLGDIMGKITAMGGDVEKMQADDKDAADKEKLAAEEDEKEALAAGDEEDEKGNKEGDQ